jgi:D-threo-aldose 1-dehydrogenase
LRHGVPLPAAALQFALGHPAVASVVAGFSSPQEVRASAAAVLDPIPPEFWDELKNEGLIRTDAPVGWKPPGRVTNDRQTAASG